MHIKTKSLNLHWVDISNSFVLEYSKQFIFCLKFYIKVKVQLSILLIVFDESDIMFRFLGENSIDIHSLFWTPQGWEIKLRFENKKGIHGIFTFWLKVPAIFFLHFRK